MCAPSYGLVPFGATRGPRFGPAGTRRGVLLQEVRRGPETSPRACCKKLGEALMAVPLGTNSWLLRSSSFEEVPSKAPRSPSRRSGSRPHGASNLGSRCDWLHVEGDSGSRSHRLGLEPAADGADPVCNCEWAAERSHTSCHPLCTSQNTNKHSVLTTQRSQNTGVLGTLAFSNTASSIAKPVGTKRLGADRSRTVLPAFRNRSG